MPGTLGWGWAVWFSANLGTARGNKKQKKYKRGATELLNCFLFLAMVVVAQVVEPTLQGLVVPLIMMAWIQTNRPQAVPTAEMAILNTFINK